MSAGESPSVALMRLVNGYQVSQAIHAAAVLGIADLLADGPQCTEELARKTGSHPASLYRLLRALAAVHVFHEEGGRRFALTAMGECLRSDAPDPVAPWATFVGRPYLRRAWDEIVHSVRSGDSAFRHVHGAGVWEYRARHKEEVILPIQREEFGMPITLEDQPDLNSIATFYQSGRGGLWVAKVDAKIVGTIGLKDIGGARAALRKMFVVSRYRGSACGVAARLLHHLLGAAEEAQLKALFLGTTDSFKAAHRFYEKSGFIQIAKDRLPARFPIMAVDSRFYAIRLPRTVAVLSPVEDHP